MIDILTKTLIEFGQWVRRWRDACNYTQEELGDLAGVTKQYISNLERAEQSSYTGKPTRPDIDVVDKLATALKRPVIEARNLAGYGLPKGVINSIEEAIDATSFFNQKNLSEQDREAIRPLLQSADRMIELLSAKRIDDTEAAEKLFDKPLITKPDEN